MGIQTAIIGSALLGAGESYISGREQSDAASDAAKAQERANQQNIALQGQIYADQTARFEPYRQAGLQGLYGTSGVMNLLGHTQAAPGVPAYNPFTDPQGGQQPVQPAQTGPDYAGYVAGSPDLQNALATLRPQDMRYIANQGYDANGDGQISAEEYGRFHYTTMGQKEGRTLPQPQQARTNPGSITARGDGSFQQGGNGPPRPTDGPVAAPAAPSMTDTLRSTPGYGFLQDEARRSNDAFFASRGKANSGAAASALQDRAMGIADQTYQQAVNNNLNLANIGMGAVAQINSAASAYGANTGNALGRIGDAQAQGAYGQANATSQSIDGITQAIAGGVGAYGGYKGWGTNKPTAPFPASGGGFGGGFYGNRYS